MTKAKQKQAIIIHILAANSIDGLTSRELFNEMESKEQGAFTGGVDGVGKELLYLKSKGIVKNGLSKIISGRTQLTWMNTPAVENDVFPEEPEEYSESDTDDSSTLTLYAGDELDAPFIQIITALRAAQHLPAPVLIESKQQKIDTLERLGALMSANIRWILAQIVADLQELEEIPEVVE